MLHPAKARVIAAQVRRELASLGRDAGSFDARRYFRAAADFGFYNTGTARMREVARRIYRLHRHAWSVEDATGLADILMRDRYLEAKSVGIEVLGLYGPRLPPRMLGRCKRWLAAGLSANWATTDAMCGRIIGPLVAARPALVPRLTAWARHRDLWVRRAAAVGLIPMVRRGAGLDAAYHVARALHHDREDLIQKAVGWLLREAGKADAARLERYLRSEGPRIPRTTVRYAIERFDERTRRGLLVATDRRRSNHGR